MDGNVTVPRTHRWEIKLRGVVNGLGAKERRLAEYFFTSYDKLETQTIADIAGAAGTSEATVVRLCHKMGYSGLKELKLAIAKERSYPDRVRDQEGEPDDRYDDLTKRVFLGAISALQDTMGLLDSTQVELATQAICRANHITLYAIGGSVPVARSFSHQLMKLGISCNVYNEFQPSIIAAEKYAQGDVAIAITHSGATPAIVAALESAHNKGATTICITGYGDSPITRCADIQFFTSSGTLLTPWDNSLGRIAQISVVNLIYANVGTEYGRYHR